MRRKAAFRHSVQDSTHLAHAQVGYLHGLLQRHSVAAARSAGLGMQQEEHDVVQAARLGACWCNIAGGLIGKARGWFAAHPSGSLSADLGGVFIHFTRMPCTARLQMGSRADALNGLCNAPALSSRQRCHIAWNSGQLTKPSQSSSTSHIMSSTSVCKGCVASEGRDGCWVHPCAATSQWAASEENAPSWPCVPPNQNRHAAPQILSGLDGCSLELQRLSAGAASHSSARSAPAVAATATAAAKQKSAGLVVAKISPRQPLKSHPRVFRHCGGFCGPDGSGQNLLKTAAVKQCVESVKQAAQICVQRLRSFDCSACRPMLRPAL